MIRKAELKDAKQIADIDSLMFKDSLGYDFIERDLRLNSMANYFICEENKQIIGYISSWISDNTTILNFCVLKDYQNKGIGSLLFEEILKIAVGDITLEVRTSNQNAIQFYKKRGFHEVLLRKYYYSDGEDAILMLRSGN